MPCSASTGAGRTPAMTSSPRPSGSPVPAGARCCNQRNRPCGAPTVGLTAPFCIHHALGYRAAPLGGPRSVGGTAGPRTSGPTRAGRWRPSDDRRRGRGATLGARDPGRDGVGTASRARPGTTPSRSDEAGRRPRRRLRRPRPAASRPVGLVGRHRCGALPRRLPPGGRPGHVGRLRPVPGADRFWCFVCWWSALPRATERRPPALTRGRADGAVGIRPMAVRSRGPIRSRRHAQQEVAMLFLYRPRQTWMPFRRPRPRTQQDEYNWQLQQQYQATQQVAAVHARRLEPGARRPDRAARDARPSSTTRGR